MTSERLARITWSAEQVARGLPTWARTVDPAWFHGDPAGAEGWSLTCRVESTPAEQGNPTLARVAFLVDAAPYERLAPGARLQLYERDTGQRADVEILE